MKSVALYGYAASTRDQIWQSEADEIWSFNWAWDYNIPRIDRLFDLHPRWHLTHKGDQMEDHWRWLQEPHDFPIYVLYDPEKIREKIAKIELDINSSLPGIFGPEESEELDNLVDIRDELQNDIEFFNKVPAAVPYPIDEVLENVGRAYFTSSVSYALGLALLEGFDRIELYGVDMGTSTEYGYQKAGCEYLIGVAEGRGVDVYVPEKSKLMHSGLYAYDGGFQMISRQTLEKFRAEYQKQYDERLAHFHRADGTWNTIKQQMEEETNEVRKAQLQRQAQQAYQQFIAAKDNMLAIDVSLQVMNHMIDEVDVKAPDLTIHNNMAVKV